jgi:hypothetical protein
LRTGKPPVRATVRSLRRQGQSYGQIKKLTGLKRSTIQSIIKAPSSRTTRKGLATKRPALKQADVKRIFRFVSESWTNRTKSWGRIKAELHLEASVTTIRRAMKKHGYRRCVACRRPFISKKQAAKRLAFAIKYRWWGTADWRRFCGAMRQRLRQESEGGYGLHAGRTKRATRTAYSLYIGAGG